MLSKELLFDASTGVSNSFDELFKRINNDTIYFEVWRYPTFYEFLVNLIKALINNKNITLIDKDFSHDEYSKLGFSGEIEIKHSIELPLIKIYDENTLTNRVINSKSSITFFTSGTTGLPKKIVHSISTLTRMLRIGDKYKDNVWALAYNPTHMAGIQVIFQALLNANKMVYVFDASNENLKKSFLKNGITNISATPTFYRLLMSDKAIFPFVKRITLGGEKSDTRLYNLLSISFPNAKINNIYASTELGSLFVSDTVNFTVPISIAKKVKIEENELMIHKSLLSWHTDEEWYKTGDLVEIINENPLRFRFQSRKNEIINVGGYKVNPNEIEDEIRKFPEILEVRVFGKYNSVLGNIICAEIVLFPNMSIEKKVIFERLKNNLQEYKIPRIVKVLEKIEVTRTGKLIRK